VSTPLLDALRQDLKQAVRALLKSPGFTLVAIASLAIGIAGNATIFSVADAILFRPLPGISDPGRLVDVGRTQNGRPIDTMSYPNYADLRDRNTVFAGLAAYRPTAEAFGLTVDGSAQQAYGTEVSANYFEVAGVPMRLGRAFESDDDRIERARAVIVIGFHLWERRFNRDPEVVGRDVTINGQPFTVIGVAAEGFTGTNLAISDFWIPIAAYTTLRAAGSEPNDVSRNPATVLTLRAPVWMVANGRLKPGVTLAQARDEVARIARDLEREYPEANAGRSIGVEPSRPVPMPGRTAAALFITLLFSLVALILLIACTNVGGMLLARGVSRARDVSLRMALGASRARVVHLLVTESLLLSIAGAAVGIALSMFLIQMLRSIIPSLPLSVGVDLRLDWRVVTFSGLLAITTALLCGLWPALDASKIDLVSIFRSDSATRGSRRLRLRHAFVVAQMAMSVLLLVTALLLGRSLQQAGIIDRGFTVEGVEAMRLDLQLAGYADARSDTFTAELLERVGQLPGVTAAATTRGLPLTLAGFGLGPVRVPGQAFDIRSAIFPDWGVVSPGYFETLRISILGGRAFLESDRGATAPVIIVNETLARRLFPGQNAVGRSVLHQSGPPPGQTRVLQIVGVAGDGKYRSLGEEPRPFVYAPSGQQVNAQFWVLARTSRPGVVREMQSLVRMMDPNLPVLQAGTLGDLTAFNLLPQRVAVWIAGSVGAIALVLAMIGVYGLTAHAVAQRRREIGIRMALGALRGQVLRMTVRRSLMLTMVGSVIGLGIAAGVAQLLTGLLYGISPTDPVSFAGSALLLGTVALIASVLPARRAASVNPVEALRAE
jgi:predicted permease